MQTDEAAEIWRTHCEFVQLTNSGDTTPLAKAVVAIRFELSVAGGDGAMALVIPGLTLSDCA
ncbi:hypothetical protein [Bradyrhizobium sp. SZCCHNR1045]|uniref:hypothetical protein n=1 Tax=Bradyrhizobium sp. SZCCHNR1045 TaxID=3057353 RepID=UPI0029165634|nr:hypothetical protein [Bradyrhizobium sp. SZCCHNR1045]